MERLRSRLIDKANKTYNEIDFQLLEKSGFHRDIDNYSLNIVYPYKNMMEKIYRDEIFSNCPKEPVSLYINIPFCLGKCFYCGYLNFPQIDESVQQQYVNALLQELDIYIENLGGIKVDSIYIGGGTPTIIKASLLDILLKGVLERVKYEPDIEITCETHPIFTDKEHVKVLADNGVNRVSMGVQSFNDDILKFINRKHNENDIYRAIENIREEGIQNLNIDLIIGLPYQNMDVWTSDIDKADKVADSVCTYSLSIKADSVFSRWFKDGNEEKTKVFPNFRDRAVMRIYAEEYFSYNNYEPIIIDWFVKQKGLDHKYQRQMWSEMKPLIGIGIGSYSYLNGIQYYNVGKIPDYLNLISDRTLPLDVGKRLTDMDKLSRAVFLGVKYGINLHNIKEKYNISLTDVYEEELAYLNSLNLITISDGCLELTKYPGKLLADEIGKYLAFKKHVY